MEPGTQEGMADQDFDLAFAAASGIDVDKLNTDDADDANDVGGEQTPEELAATAKAEEERVAEEERKVADTPEAKAEAEHLAAETKAEEERKAAATAEEERKAAEGKTAEAQKAAAAKAETERLAAETKAEEERKAAEQTLTPTAEEAAAIKTLEKEWPEVSAGMAAKERLMLARVDQLVAKRVQEVLAAVQQQVAPLTASVVSSAQRDFNTVVTTAHADAFTLLPEVEKWVDSQPKFLQDGYNRVLDAGTADETVALLQLFKDATGRSKTKTPEELAADAAAETKRLATEETTRKREEERKRKLASQEGVNSRASGKTGGGVDEDDFEGAFNEAAK